MSPKRFLFTAKFTPDHTKKGGVQTWIATVADELRSRGHVCTMWNPKKTSFKKNSFDYGIIANLCVTAPSIHWSSKNLIVSHGVIKPEAPVANRPQDKIAFTSEEVKDHWGLPGPIIRQPIDLDFWRPDPESQKKYLLHYGYRIDVPGHEAACQILGIPRLRLKRGSWEEVRSAFHKSKCVLATGRAAVEAMACGVPVVICDNRNTYQQALLDPDTLGAMTRNYSGRGGVSPTGDLIAKAVTKAIEDGSLRQHTEEYHDSKKIVDQILNILEGK